MYYFYYNVLRRTPRHLFIVYYEIYSQHAYRFIHSCSTTDNLEVNVDMARTTTSALDVWLRTVNIHARPPCGEARCRETIPTARCMGADSTIVWMTHGCRISPQLTRVLILNRKSRRSCATYLKNGILIDIYGPPNPTFRRFQAQQQHCHRLFIRRLPLWFHPSQVIQCRQGSIIRHRRPYTFLCYPDLRPWLQNMEGPTPGICTC